MLRGLPSPPPVWFACVPVLDVAMLDMFLISGFTLARLNQGRPVHTKHILAGVLTSRTSGMGQTWPIDQLNMDLSNHGETCLSSFTSDTMLENQMFSSSGLPGQGLVRATSWSGPLNVGPFLCTE